MSQKVKDFGGYSGYQLRVNLNSKEFKKEKVDYENLRNFLGGVGYSSKLLYDELDKAIDPLGNKNKIVFSTGPLTNNITPGGGSVEVCFKSPQTGGWGESRCGGDFGPRLKKAGYDFLIIEGIIDKPSYLVINNDKVSIESAENIIYKTTSEKDEIIRGNLENGEEYSIMVIGPAGENLVKFATITEGGRAAGRVGGGAVMGSKNLLAIAVRGTNKVKAFHEDKYINKLRKLNTLIKNSEAAQGFKKHGTTGDMAECDELGDWPTQNWRSNSWGKGEELYNHFFENNLKTNTGCYSGCPMACGRIAKVDKGKYKTPEHDGGEYESISAFTAFVLNEDMDVAVHSTYLCDELGIDTISTGGIIAYAMDCFENGYIDKRYTDLNLSWGNSEVLPEIVEKIAYKKGIGKILSEGVKYASDEFGEETKKYAIHGKGLEAPAHDPRSGKALAITYGTATRGMCHMHPLEGMVYDSGKIDFGMSNHGVPDPEKIDRWDEKGKGEIVAKLQNCSIIPDIVCTCKFFMYVGINIDDFAELISLATGWNIDVDELLEIGERTINVQRLFNIREGFGYKDDLVPKRMTEIPEFGDYKDIEDCSIKDYKMMLDEYYDARGWDKTTGYPNPDTLKKLKLKL